MINKSRLGRGLNALIPNKTHKAINEENAELDILEDISQGASMPMLNIIAINDIIRDEAQPRKSFEEESLQELADSIKVNGVIQPIILHRKASNSKYQIIAGERRWRAAKIAGLSEIPAIVKDYNPRYSAEIALIENIQRENLNPLEEAMAYQQLIDKFALTHENIAKIAAKSRSHITNYLRLLLLPEIVKKSLLEKKITMGHAKILINVENCDKIVEEIILNCLNVRQTEKLVQELNNKEKQTSKLVNNNINNNASTININNTNKITQKNNLKELRDGNKENHKHKDIILLEEKLSQNLGLEVIIKDNNDKIGSVTIKFKTLADLGIILNKLK